MRATADLREYHLIQRNITLLVDLQPGPLPIFVNREEIQQVVLNLVMNAEHAIGRGPGTGTIVMRTQSDGRAHTLQVSDDGPGISPELRGRVFEPFFTTKDVGEGTGLGLSISLGIATAHGGALTLCDTAQGRLLPADAADVSSGPADGDRSPTMRRRVSRVCWSLRTKRRFAGCSRGFCRAAVTR